MEDLNMSNQEKEETAEEITRKKMKEAGFPEREIEHFIKCFLK